MCAVALHLLLLGIHLSVDVPLSKGKPELSITLLNEQPTQEPSPPEPIAPPSDDSFVEPPSPAKTANDQVENIIVVEPSESAPPPERPRVQININSDDFKQFLRNETDEYQRSNPAAIGDFNQTFEPIDDDATVVSARSKQAQAQIRQNGVGMSQDKNGRRTCYAQIPNIADSNAPPSTLSKDCTPPKKFILDLDKPRNN